MDPIALLRADHEQILSMCKVLHSVRLDVAQERTPDSARFERILDFFRVFIDRGHHGKEEELLFPALEAAVGLRARGMAAALSTEHGKLRILLRRVSAAYTGLRSGDQSARKPLAGDLTTFADQLAAHVEKENAQLLPLVEQLPAERRARLVAAFERLENERVGAEKAAAFRQLATDMAAEYLKTE